MSQQPSNVIYLSNVRLSFPHLAEPQEKVNDDGKKRISYSGDFIMPPDHPGFTGFMRVYGALAVEKWKEHAQTIMGMIHQDRKSRCYGYGQEKIKKSTLQPYDGYVGMVFITAGKDQPPQVIQPDGKPVDPVNTMAYQAFTRKMYGGCRVNAAVRPWIQENKHGRGVRCDLIAVQFAGDDKPFGEGVVDASGMFGQVAAPTAGVPSPAGGMPPLPGAVPGTVNPQSVPSMPAPPSFAAPSLPPFMQPK